MPRSLLKWLTDPELEEQVQARTAELAASVDLYRRLIEESTEGILIHQDGVIRFANQAMVRAVGYSSATELLGRPVATLLAPEYREEVRARVEARLRGEPVPATVEIEALRRDGNRIWVGVTATVLEWEGAPAMRVAVIDISERRALLDDIQKARVEAETARGVAEEASLAAQDHRLDLVLMDVQMPVMDGFAATAAIRRREADEPTRRRIPIVALTAFAVKGDRERCLAAGMDDYLSKPIQRDQLAAVLARLGDDPIFDLSVALGAMEGDRELLTELLAIFAEEAPGQLRAVREAVSRSDPAALAFAAHTLKGGLHALGASKAAALAERLEQLGREGGSSGAPGLLAALESEIEQVLLAAAEARRDAGIPPVDESPKEPRRNR